MIIACSACSARFRIADEKVGPQGARVRCTRCGHLFVVRPPEPIAAPPPAPPPPSGEDTFGLHAEREPTGTGGWPTGSLDLDDSSAPETPAPPGPALAADPFAAFAGVAPTGPAAPAPPPAPAPEAPFDLGSLPVTDLSALEKTGAIPVPAPLPPDPFPPEPTPVVDGDLALEDRTPGTGATAARARWSEPQASQAVAVGADGFQEVDLRGTAPADPDFEALATGATQEAPLPPRPASALPADPAGAPPPIATPPSAAAASPGSPAPAPATAAPASPEVTEGRRIEPARVRAAAMNVLSLAALLLVTIGLVAWWRGERPGDVVRWPWSAPPAAVEVRQVSSGIYEGTRGMPVVFVRGVVRAGTAPLEGPVEVRVELSRGGRTLGTAAATAGAVPSTEEVAVVSTPDELGRLVAALGARSPRRLEPGEELPFLALLPAPEGDVGTLRFHVEPVQAKGR